VSCHLTPVTLSNTRPTVHTMQSMRTVHSIRSRERCNWGTPVDQLKQCNPLHPSINAINATHHFLRGGLWPAPLCNARLSAFGRRPHTPCWRTRATRARNRQESPWYRTGAAHLALRADAACRYAASGTTRPALRAASFRKLWSGVTLHNCFHFHFCHCKLCSLRYFSIARPMSCSRTETFCHYHAHWLEARSSSVFGLFGPTPPCPPRHLFGRARCFLLGLLDLAPSIPRAGVCVGMGAEGHRSKGAVSTVMPKMHAIGATNASYSTSESVQSMQSMQSGRRCNQCNRAFSALLSIQAHAHAHAQGHAQGHAKGHAKGHAQGHTQGHAQGHGHRNRHRV
jgi:hypothetical protein